ncbi:MAG: PLDc N-terminal domain-containing protein [Candidatus Aenigmatarchaeota archaeon]
MFNIFWLWNWLFLPFGAFFVFWLIILIVAFVFWLKMLIDVLVRKKLEDRLIWVLVLIFLNILGALLYYFLVYRKRR